MCLDQQNNEGPRYEEEEAVVSVDILGLGSLRRCLEGVSAESNAWNPWRVGLGSEIRQTAVLRLGAAGV